MLRDAEEIRHALAAGGWKVDWLRERALIVEERVFDVTRVGVRAGGLRGWASVIRDCVDGDQADAYESLVADPMTLSRRAHSTKVYARACDADRAREELEELDAWIRACGSFDAALERVAARGWSVDRRKSVEDTWDFTWSIRATRADEELVLGGGFSAGGLAPGLTVEDDGVARSVAPGAVFRLTIKSAKGARRLLDALVPPEAPSA